MCNSITIHIQFTENIIASMMAMNKWCSLCFAYTFILWSIFISFYFQFKTIKANKFATTLLMFHVITKQQIVVWDDIIFGKIYSITNHNQIESIACCCFESNIFSLRFRFRLSYEFIISMLMEPFSHTWIRYRAYAWFLQTFFPHFPFFLRDENGLKACIVQFTLSQKHYLGIHE